ncbi:MAG: family 14 glycosylhydrolase [Abditibacteriota bacterium]|nr:family 14 glycosylhydrolase [Abditibacteriota bacterium]
MKAILIAAALLLLAAASFGQDFVPETVDEDGEYVTADKAGRRAVALADKPGMRYLYYRLTDRSAVPAEPALAIEYYADTPCGVDVQYNSSNGDHFTGAGFTCREGEWTRVTVPLPRFEPRGAMHEGCDVRLVINDWRFDSFMPKNRVFISSVTLTENKGKPEPVRPLYEFRRPQGAEYVMGNDLSYAKAPVYRRQKVDVVQSYITWGGIEKSTGEYDWTYWDRQAELLREWGFKLQAFIAAGPSCATPAWYLASPEHVGAVCLEHGEETKIESVWNTAIDSHIRSFLEAFYARYRDILYSVEFGISGDFGETIYPYWGVPWTFAVNGDYHTHPGYWCGDPLARRDFAASMQKKYGSVSRLNAAWHTDFASFDEELMPFEDEKSKDAYFDALTPETRRRWYDLVDWYRDSMERLASRWLDISDGIFTDTPVYLAVGGHSSPEQGCLFSHIAKLAAQRGAGVRITNEMSEYTFNVTGNRYMSDSCRLYGAPCGFEPGDKVDVNGVTARVFGAATCGVKQYFDFDHNGLASQEYMDRQLELLPYLNKGYKPIRNVALWYPDRDLSLYLDLGAYMSRTIPLMRNMADVTIADSQTVSDGILEGMSVLVLWNATVFEEEDLRNIGRFVREGGRVFALDCKSPVTVSGRPAEIPGLTVVPDFAALQQAVNRVLEERGECRYPCVKNVFVSRVGPRKALVFNQNGFEASVQITMEGKTKLCSVPAHDMKEFEF